MSKLLEKLEFFFVIADGYVCTFKRFILSLHVRKPQTR